MRGFSATYRLYHVRDGIRRRRWGFGAPIRAAVFLAVLLFAASASAHQAEVEKIPSGSYFETALHEIQQAKSTIHLTMYVVVLPPKKPGSQVHRLLEALVQARERGVEVKVLLDQNLRWDDEGNRGNFMEPTGKNKEAFRYLRDRGVEVSFDEATKLMHAKILVIDEETVILGSTNWSEGALARNLEGNALIRSKDFARDVLADFRGRWPRGSSRGGAMGAARIPRAFLLDPERFGKMVAERDTHGFNGYLTLLKLRAESPQAEEVSPDWKTLLGVIGYRGVLNRMQEKYGLIRYSKEPGENPRISFLPAGNWPDAVELPMAYWEWGWDRRLSFSGKAMLLLNQLYSADSRTAPTWFRSQPDLARRHGVSVMFISKGMLELRRLNLIEVQAGAIEGGNFAQRDANRYTLNPLYDPAEQGRAFQALEAKYGKEKTAQAARYAAVVYEGNDLRAIERLITLEEEFGAAIVKKAVRKMASLHGSNPKRTIAYLVRTIQGMGGD